MSQPRALLFDYFGVICVDQYQSWLDEVGQKRTGQYKQLSEDADLNKIGMDDFFTGLAKLSGRYRDEVRDNFLANTDLDQELLHLILKLKQKYKIGLISNSSTEWIEAAINEFHLANLFDAVIVSGEVGFIKPQPQIYKIALKRLGESADKTIFIDDNKKNVEAAIKLGISGIVYRDLSRLKRDLKQMAVL